MLGHALLIIPSIDTFGVQSVSITDTTGNRVCLQCVFSSFSTDSRCTVELVDSSTTLVHYSTVFNRSTNIAEGCITDVTSGLYDIRVYDQGSNVVVVTVFGVNVTFGFPSTTIIFSTTRNILATAHSSSSVEQGTYCVLMLQSSDLSFFDSSTFNYYSK